MFVFCVDFCRFEFDCDFPWRTVNVYQRVTQESSGSIVSYNDLIASRDVIGRGRAAWTIGGRKKNWRPEIQQLIRRKLFGSKLPSEILEYQLDLLVTKFATMLIDPGLSRPQQLRISDKVGDSTNGRLSRSSIAMNIHELYRRVRYCAIPGELVYLNV